MSPYNCVFNVGDISWTNRVDLSSKSHGERRL